MGVQLFSNNATTLLATGISAVDTVLTVTTGEGAKFSSPTGSDYELVSISSGGNNEVVKMTSRTADALTVERGFEGAAQIWGSNAVVEARVTKNTLETLQQPSLADWLVQRWVASTIGGTFALAWRGVAYSPSLRRVCAVAQNGTGTRVMTSDNGGIDWTLRNAATDKFWESIAWSPSLNLFCAVSQNAATTDTIMTSPDGITWTSRLAANDSVKYSVVWAEGLSLFVVVGDANTGNSVQTSPDGITWTDRVAASDLAWKSVTWSTELALLVAVASNGVAAGVMTSTDAVTWTTRVPAQDTNWETVTWAPKLSLFAAVANNSFIMTSPDGVTWTSRSVPSGTTQGWWGLAWSEELGYFAAVADGGSAGISRLMVSKDGVNWELAVSENTETWRSIVWVPDFVTFVAVCEDNVILTTQ